MAIEHTIWKISELPMPLPVSQLQDERELENMIAANISILNGDWLLIGRQVPTSYNKYIDLLALDSTGSIVIIELKRDQTPREVVAQVLDYASWVQSLDAGQIAEIYQRFRSSTGKSVVSLNSAFQNKFGLVLDEELLNSSHQMIIVAAQLDSSSERIIRYLSTYSIPLNIVFFKVFSDGNNRYLSRAWFFDLAETQIRAVAPRGVEPWNGEFYVSFGHDRERNWEEARKHGFISAGGGKWYTKTLNMLSKGDRIWVNIPKRGYVGVGCVERPAVKVDEFMVDTIEGHKPLLEVVTAGNYHRDHINEDDEAEYVVGVKWLKTLPISEAVSEVGLFGNQNTVARPTTPKWNQTIDTLRRMFDVP